MPNNIDLFSKVQQANLYFANLMNEYVDSFVFSLDRNENIKHKADELYELLEAIQYQMAKGLYYENEVTQLLYEKVDCLTPIYNSVITVDTSLINPIISNTSVIYGAPGKDGVGILDATIVDGDLIITYTNSVIENVGRVLGEGVAEGGTTGQFLVKASDTDYDTEWIDIPDPDGFVPYTGATEDVDLGANSLKAESITLNPLPVTIPTEQGSLYFDETKQTVAMIMNGTIQHIGQDSYFYVKNKTGALIPKGTCVGFAGTDGASGHLLISKYLADGSNPSTYFMGVTAEDIPNGQFGQVTHFGELEGINTSGYTAGALLYASSTVAGAFQTTAPLAPNNIILVAATVNSKNNGAIIVRPQIGSNINNDEGVKIISGATGDILQLQSNGLWENKTVDSLGLVPETRTITINGETLDLSEDREWVIPEPDLTPYQLKSEKGEPDGYAPLDSGGKLDPSYLPTIDIDDLGDVVITAPTEGQALVYDAVSGLWENKTVATPAGVRAVETFSATAGQTIFTTSGYVVGSIDVYLNGSRLQETEYTATDETTIVFPVGLELNDIVEVVIWSISSTETGLLLDTSGFGDDISYSSITNVLTIDKYDWMDLARGYTVEPTLFSSTATYEVYQYIYTSSTFYRKILDDGTEDAFYAESALTNKLCDKQIIV